MNRDRIELLEASLGSTWDLSAFGFLDPRDLGIGDDPNFLSQLPFWRSLGLMRRLNRGERVPIYVSEPQLDIHRRRIRATVENSEIALNVINARIAYAIGDGLTHAVEARDPADESLARDCQAVLDAFAEMNDLSAIETECVARMTTDGEAFVRLFPADGGLLACRIVEPEFVRSPNGDSSRDSFGVRNHEGDPQSVEGYWITYPDDQPDYELVPEAEVCHIRDIDVPLTSKRGISPFWPVEGTLRAAEDLLASTVSTAKTRAKVALTQTFENTVSSAAQSLLNNQAVAKVDTPGGQQQTLERLPYGSILRFPASSRVEMPSANLGASDNVAVMQMILRLIGTRFSMPEYIVSGDASNANFASTMVSEAPFVRAMQRLQKHVLKFFSSNRYSHPRGLSRRSLLWRQLMHAAKSGLLPWDVTRRVDVTTTAPTLVVRDKDREATTNKTYVDMGVLTRDEVRADLGREPLEPDEREDLQPQDAARQDTGEEEQGGFSLFGEDIRRDKSGRKYCVDGGKRVKCDHTDTKSDAKENLLKLLKNPGLPRPDVMEELTSQLRDLPTDEVRKLKKELGLRLGSGKKEKLVSGLIQDANRIVSTQVKYKRLAKAEGVDFELVKDLAKGVRDMAREHYDMVQGVRKMARDTYKHYNGKHLTMLHPAWDGGDHVQLKNWDLVAKEVAAHYPDLFGGKDWDGDGGAETRDLDQMLFDMYAEGPPPAPSWDDAYGEALRAVKNRAGSREEVPF